MGQKVHPLGFRLTTTQKHRSVWFAEFQNYPKLIEEDSNSVAPCLGQHTKEILLNQGYSSEEILNLKIQNHIASALRRLSLVQEKKRRLSLVKVNLMELK